MVYFLGTDRLETRTQVEFQKFKKSIEKENQNFNFHVELVILSTKNKTQTS